MRKTDEKIDPVVKERAVPLSPRDAFELFTDRLASWWPLATHSIAGRDTTTVTVDGRVGGRITETTPDGNSYAWADIIAWDPPHRFVMTWHPRPDPEAASIVEVRFEPTAEGCTLHLEHRAWEELGAELGPKARDQYDPGWDEVLGHYLDKT